MHANILYISSDKEHLCTYSEEEDNDYLRGAIAADYIDGPRPDEVATTIADLFKGAATYTEYDVQDDGILGELTFDDIPWKEFINLLYLEDYDISGGDDQYYRELLLYTDAGENMIVPLEKVDKKHLQSYIDGFDINHEVSLWWPNGFKSEDKWFPHDNMKEHYEDYEAYLKKLQRICNHMPY